ncbi:hypothetical protein HYT53_06020 [Candidatus Woesearchaeota archaeon]|nr:hypothetical protein [Candidatus Woesearchaeota archaeon]
MEAKDFILLMMLPLILVGIVIYTDKNPPVTGAVTAKQTESNVIGTYSINPSFKAKIDYDLSDYNKIKEQLDFIIVCKQNDGDIESCMQQAQNDEQFKDHKFEWVLNCDKEAKKVQGAEKVLYDFAEFFQNCIDSEDNNCLCIKDDFRLSKEKINEYGLSNKKYEIVFKDKPSLRQIEASLSKINDKSADYYLSQSVDTKGISIWTPNLYIIAYTNNKLFLNLIFMEITGIFRSLGPMNEIVLYKNYNSTSQIMSIDFVRQEGENLVYPTLGKITKKPDDLHPCQIKSKNIYKFCVTKKDTKVTVYDNIDRQVKERNVTIKFAAYIP